MYFTDVAEHAQHLQDAVSDFILNA